MYAYCYDVYLELMTGIYPFPDADPFIIQHRPDVYFLGNQPEFETALVGGQWKHISSGQG